MSAFDESLSRSSFLMSLDWRFMATVGIPAIIVVAGWFFVYWLNNRRDVATRKRESRLRAMEAAYLRLANAANREEPTDKLLNDIESFVSEIQLYGTPKQVDLMHELVEAYKRPNNTVSFDPILMELRDALRKELRLEPISGAVWWLRLNRKNLHKAGKSFKT